jgi:methionine-rich copper-binding protein CopC
MRWPARATAILVVLVGTLAPAAPAAAHGQLAMSDPVADSTVTGPKTDLTLYFTETPASTATFAVTAPSGKRVDGAWRTGEPKRLDKPVQEYYLVDGKYEPRVFNTGYPALVAVSHWPEPGAYTVAYQSVASDGEAVKGTVRFVYAGPLTQPPPGWTAPTTPTSTAPAATPSAAPGLFSDLGNEPAQNPAQGQGQASPVVAPFVLTDWLIPAGITLAVALMVISAARRPPIALVKKRRKERA